MNRLLIYAILAITSALVFYTAGVFGERKAGILKRSHVVIFWTGFACDTLGTLIMTEIARSSNYTVKSVLIQKLHGIFGTAAILLMLFHAIWATWVLYKNDMKLKRVFHKFSIIVWAIWLIPYFIGMLIGMLR